MRVRPVSREYGRRVYQEESRSDPADWPSEDSSPHERGGDSLELTERAVELLVCATHLARSCGCSRSRALRELARVFAGQRAGLDESAGDLSDSLNALLDELGW